jgi:hypothetical protein
MSSFSTPFPASAAALPGQGCPYDDLAQRAFFRNAILRRGDLALDPDPNFALTMSSRVMSAGSCFAARIAQFIKTSGVNYLAADDRAATDDSVREETPNQFSLRYGNIYTVRHLLQLLLRATGVWVTEPPVARDKNGRYRNLARPAVLSYSSIEALRADDRAHLRNLLTLLGAADVFIFTLGLTEHWVDTAYDLVLPTTPGCGYGEFDPSRHRFRNASLADVADELSQCFGLLQQINPRLKILLTLSPVPLVATYTPTSAIEATFYSKSLLRQAIAQAIAAWPGQNVTYFPSYEIITNPHVIGENFEPDMRSISAAGVARVMAQFRQRFLAEAAPAVSVADDDGMTGVLPALSIGAPLEAAAAGEPETDPVCDEENVWRAYLRKKGA